MTLRLRIIIGLTGLLAGIVLTAVIGIVALRDVRRSAGTELDLLRSATETGTGLATTVFDEIRAAEQYLAEPGAAPRTQFQEAADAAFDMSAYW